MKKSIIAGAGVAALGFAALPFAGVFAATSSKEFTDKLSVTVDNGCTLENGGNTDGTYVDRSFSKNISVGTVAVLEGAGGAGSTDTAAMTIKCNVSSGTVTVSYKTSDEENAYLIGTTDSSKHIAPGAQTNTENSGWAIKSNETNTASQPFHDYTAPSTSGTFLTATASASGTTFNPSYQVYVAQGQAADTYKGNVTYNIALQ